MREYLIRSLGADPCVSIHRSDLARVLTPRGWDVEPVEGWGDYRIRVAGAEVSFSMEAPGWQVSVEGDLPADQADALIEQISQQIGDHAGERTESELLQR